MRKQRQSLIKIENPGDGAHYTSRSRAIEYESRGRAVFTSATSIRFREDQQVLQENRDYREQLKDLRFWNEVAAQRGNCKAEVWAVWGARGPAPSILSGPQCRTMQATIALRESPKLDGVQ